MSRLSQSMHDRHITIFSPEGKLYQIEYAFKAVKNSNLTAIAIKGKDSVCIATQKKIPNQQVQQDKLIDPSCITSLFSIKKDIGAVVLGIGPDCKSLVTKCREIAGEFSFKNGIEIPVSYLCQKMADQNQLYTQHASMRLLGSSAILIGMDDEEGPSLYKLDPAGHYSSYKACTIGAKESEGNNLLEKIIKNKGLNTLKEVIHTTVDCLQTTLGIEFRQDDLEVAIVDKDNPNFILLSESEIDEILTSIAEKD